MTPATSALIPCECCIALFCPSSVPRRRREKLQAHLKETRSLKNYTANSHSSPDAKSRHLGVHLHLNEVITAVSSTFFSSKCLLPFTSSTATKRKKKTIPSICLCLHAAGSQDFERAIIQWFGSAALAGDVIHHLLRWRFVIAALPDVRAHQKAAP